MGAGRIRKEDKIDMAVGIILNKKVGNYVEKGDCLGYIHTNNDNTLEEAKQTLLKTIKIEEQEKQPIKTILKIIS